MYEIGKRRPDPETLKRFADFFGVSVDYLLGRDYADDPLCRVDNGMAQIPVLGFIKAGYDLYADQQVIDYELIDRKTIDDGEYFYLIVTGDSMIEEGIRPGMRVLVRRQDYVDQGKIGVVIVDGHEATIKRVFYLRDGQIMLQASNKDVPTRVYNPDEVIIQGQVKKVEWDV